MNFRELLKNQTLYLDGATGTMLQNAGLKSGELTERWNVSHPDEGIKLHKSYFDAGSNIVLTNTFGANSLKFDDEELESIIKAAVANARKAAELSENKGPKFVAFEQGPLGKLLKPFGTLDFEDAVSIYSKSMKLGVKYGVDLIFIGTMNDCYETKAALLAAKECTDLPVFVSNSYGMDGKLMTGANPAAMIAMLESMGADAIGINCSLGPEQLSDIVDDYLKYASVPIIVKPNAGLPRVENGETIYDVTPDRFAEILSDFIAKGVRLVGGCCGTTPEHISKLVTGSKDISPVPLAEKDYSVTSSYTHAVFLGGPTVLIGERINPTGKKKFKAALLENDINYILNEGLKQQDNGADVLDVNVGLPEIDEVQMLHDAVYELQSIIDLPLQIDTVKPAAMEKALRHYNGKAMINSVSGTDESMDTIFPLAKKYGGLIIALTIDEDGIPKTVDKRIEIAKKIIKRAADYGISKKDLVFDPLAMTISADTESAIITLECVRRIHYELGCHTSLGVSNISFGLPSRDLINGTFFSLAMENGLSAAIINPNSEAMITAYKAYNALKNYDSNCLKFIEYANEYAEKQALQKAAALQAQSSTAKEAPEASADSRHVYQRGKDYGSELKNAIIRGLKERSGEITKTMLDDTPVMSIVNDEIIPALDIVGDGFEKQQLFLPQLLMSAEATSFAFEQVKKYTADSNETAPAKCPFVIATVKGDVHDIGKNIVKLVLENYGYTVYDLGTDVDPDDIVNKAIEVDSPLVGLSALMTTTLPAMEETIKLLKIKKPDCKIVVGGAVLTEDYAASIGATKYAKDAMETVRFSESVFSELK